MWVKCVFDIVIVLDQTLCLQPMAGHSAWRHSVTQKPILKHNSKLDNLRAGFEIAEEHRLGYFAEVNFQDAIGQGGLFGQCPWIGSVNG